MAKKEPVYVRYVELTPLCERVLDKMERGSKDREAEALLKAEKKLEAVTEWFIENGAFHCDVHDLIGLRKILEAED